MDRIPIGGHPEEPDNVVRLPGADPDPESVVDDDVSYEEALAADAGADDERASSPSPPPGTQVAELVEQGVKIGAGLFAAGASALADALRSTMPSTTEPEKKDPAATLAGAGLGAAVTAAEATAGAAKQVAETIGPAITWLLEPRFAKDAQEVAAGATRVLDGQWKATQAELVGAATSFLQVLVPEIARALAGQVDLTQLVRERVDLNAIVDDVDIDRILDRIDLDQVVSRVDVDAIVDRVDVDRVIARTDLLAVIDRIDVAAIAQEVIEDVDLPRVIRESSGLLAGETVRTARVQGMHADHLVAKIVDRVIRREARELSPDQAREDPA
jgi:hypothetical protein